MLGPTDGGGLSDEVLAREGPTPTVIAPDVDSALDEAQARRDAIAKRQQAGVNELLGGGRGPGGGMGRSPGPTASGAMGGAAGMGARLATGDDPVDPRGPAAGERRLSDEIALRNDVLVPQGEVPAGASDAEDKPVGGAKGPGQPVPAAKPAFTEATVEEGDTLWRIAKRAYGDGDVARMVDLILEANPGISADLIQPDQVLRIPTVLPEGVITTPLVPPTDATKKPVSPKPSSDTPTQVPTGEFRFYEVREGDTLDGIAKREIGPDATFNDIWVLNRERLESPEKIYPGQTLRIPAKR